MSIEGVPFDKIDETHIRILYDNKVPEGRTLEYKQDVYEKNENGEFAKDVSAMANSLGHIIIEVAESGGISTELCGIGAVHDLDKQIDRLEEIARTWIEPRLSQLYFKPITFDDGVRIIVVRVERSLNRPHQIKQTRRFHARSTAGNFAPNVDELREMFSMQPTLLDKIQKYRNQRVEALLKGRVAIALAGDMGNILLHVIPMSALLAGARRAAAAELLEYKDNLRPIDARFGFSYFVNFHGLVTYNSNAKNEFLQINRNGIVETAKAGIVLDIGAADKVDIIKVVPQPNIEIMIVGALASILPAINDLGFAPPHVVLITLSGVRGAQVDINTWRDKKPPITEDELYFDEVIFEDLPQNYQAVARAMRPAFDQLSNAGGEPKSPNFDATGEWKLRPRT